MAGCACAETRASTTTRTPPASPLDLWPPAPHARAMAPWTAKASPECLPRALARPPSPSPAGVKTATAWPLHGNGMANARQMHVLHGNCMAAAWQLHGSCMATAWQLHGDCMATAWQLHGYCAASACKLQRKCAANSLQMYSKRKAHAWQMHGNGFAPARRQHGKCMGAISPCVAHT